MKRLVILCLMSCAMTCAAEVYRWVDSDGKTHYGDRAPQGQADKAIKLNVAKTPAGPDPEAEAMRQQLRAIDEGRQREQAYAAQKAAAAQQQREQLAQKCKTLQNNIRDDQQTAVFYSYDDAGNRVLWTAEQRIAYSNKLQTLKQQYCPGLPE